MSSVYADGFGRWHVLVPEGPQQREVAIATMAEAMLNHGEFTVPQSAKSWVERSIAQAPVEQWDLSPGFGGFAVPITGMAHYVEYTVD